VDGKGVGKVETYTFTNVSANHTISVGFEKITFTITSSSGPNGVVSPTILVEAGDSQTFTIAPNPGYRIGDVLVDGASQGPVTSYTFTNIWKDHTISATFVALQPGSTVTAMPPSGPGVTELAGLVSGQGVFLGDVHAVSGDNMVGLTVAQGTTGRLNNGERLTQIAIVKTTNLPEPGGFVVVGSVYDILPSTAVIDKAMSLTVTYDRALLPAGVGESELGIAMYDRQAGSWMALPGARVDTASHSVSAELGRFAPCAVVAPERQATFTVKELQVSPSELSLGHTATVGVTVTNNGGESGTFVVVLKIDGAVDSSKEVTLAGGASERVEFSVVGRLAGRLAVSVEGLSATLSVVEGPSASASDAGLGWLPLVGIAVGLVGTAALLGAFMLWRRGRKRSPPSRPAAFGLTDLEVSPKELRVGESTTVAATVTNDGGHAGTYKVMLRIDGLLKDAKEVTVLAGKKERVEFTVRAAAAGTFTVKVEDLSETLTVVDSVPSPARASESRNEASAPKEA